MSSQRVLLYGMVIALTTALVGTGLCRGEFSTESCYVQDFECFYGSEPQNCGTGNEPSCFLWGSVQDCGVNPNIVPEEGFDSSTEWITLTKEAKQYHHCIDSPGYDCQQCYTVDDFGDPIQSGGEGELCTQEVFYVAHMYRDIDCVKEVCHLDHLVVVCTGSRETPVEPDPGDYCFLKGFPVTPIATCGPSL